MGGLRAELTKRCGAKSGSTWVLSCRGYSSQGAFQGTTPPEAYFVKCDSENNPQSSIDLGVVNILVGFAPLYPAEFVVIQIQQIAGQSQS